jgi:uncharacterized membrane-anchored protein YhcB (DUF1043 family)
MDRKRNVENRIFNAHTGAAAGLIIGVIVGSLLMNLADQGAPDGPAAQKVVEHVASTSRQAVGS